MNKPLRIHSSIEMFNLWGKAEIPERIAPESLQSLMRLQDMSG